MARRVGIVVLVIAAALVLARVVLPSAVQRYVNHVMARNGAYESHIGAVSLGLLRGAAGVRDVEVRKRGSKVPVPFFFSPLVDVSIQWRALLHGRIVAVVDMDEPQLNVVVGPSEETRQIGTEADWRKTVRELIRIRINHVDVRDGSAHFRDFHSNPPVNVYLSRIALTARNLTNSAEISKERPAHLELRATLMNAGTLWMRAEVDPFAKLPSFDFAGSVENADLTPWNAFLRAYAGIDVERGRFRIYSELAAKEGGFRGYVKPFFDDVQVLKLPEDERKGPLRLAWEGMVAAASKALENRRTDAVATRIPISGTVEDPRIGFWATLGNAIRNAFSRGIAPDIEHSVKER